MNYKLDVPAEHARLILAALSEVQYKLAAPVIENLLKQTDQQDKAAVVDVVSQDLPPAEAPAV